jgi:hypothetical protein
VKNQSKLNHKIVDDVSIGLLLKDVPSSNVSFQLFDNGPALHENTCFYRFKTWYDRNLDLYGIKQQYSILRV